MQRVLSASVTVDGTVVSSIRRGILVLVGLSRTDTVHDCSYMARKLLNLKIFDTPADTATATAKPWTQSAASLQLDVLLVSQFTLYAELKGNRPDFHTAMPPTAARELYAHFVAMVRKEYGAGGAEKVKDGVFGADMAVALVNDGPVTITLETSEGQFDKELAKANRPFGNNKNGRSSSPQQQQQQQVEAASSTGTGGADTDTNTASSTAALSSTAPSSVLSSSSSSSIAAAAAAYRSGE